MRFRLVLTILLLLFSCVRASASGEQPLARGTINVVLANSNGIVAVTDSRLTWTTAGNPLLHRPDPKPGQKLFRLDDWTVCAFAGFASAPLHIFPVLIDNSAGILRDLAHELSLRPRLAFDEKLSLLSFIFQSRLEAISNIRDVASDLDNYRISLTLAGYDIDGAAKVAQLTLTLGMRRLEDNRQVFDAAQTGLTETVVGKELVWQLAGQRDLAQQMLEHPQQYIGDPAVSVFAKAQKRNQADNLTVEQMRDLAVALVHRTAENNPTVGGDDQIAILRHGRVTRIEQPQFPDQRPAVHFALSVGATFAHDNEALGGSPFLAIKDTFDDVRQTVLDGNFFFRNVFISSKIMYGGGFTSFDSSNRLTDCTLVLAPTAKRNPEMLRHLLSDFHWRDVQNTP